MSVYLQEFSFDKIMAEIKRFEDLIGDTVDAVKNGVKSLDQLINGDVKFGDIFQALIDALEVLPSKVGVFFTVCVYSFSFVALFGYEKQKLLGPGFCPCRGSCPPLTGGTRQIAKKQIKNYLPDAFKSHLKMP
jgi:hypothetical protein